MDEGTTRDLLEAVEELERRLAPDDPLRSVTTALREFDERLEEHVLVGDVRNAPVTWSRIVAIGNVEARRVPCYGIYPGLVDDEDRAEIERLEALLKGRPVALMLVEHLPPLRETGTLTAAVALLGEDKDGRTVLVIGRHPDVSLPQATCLLLAAIMEAINARQRTN